MYNMSLVLFQVRRLYNFRKTLYLHIPIYHFICITIKRLQYKFSVTIIRILHSYEVDLDHFSAFF